MGLTTTYTKVETDYLLQRLEQKTSDKYTDETLAGDIIKRVDINTGENVNYRETTTWYDGSAMTDEKVDNIAFLKRDGKYYKIQLAKFDIRYFGIVNSPTLDQSAQLDAMALYADYNDIYEIDFHGFDILTSKTVVFTSGRSSSHSGLTFREAHKIKNLRISHDMTVPLIQGNKLIQFIPKYNPETEKVFALDNIIFNPYNPNYTTLSGEADVYMLGFGAFVEPETWVRPTGVQEQSNWSFDFRNIIFESPAVSYNIATADIFARNIYCENMSGQHLGLYYFFIAENSVFKNCKSFYRDDLHASSDRLLVTSLLHMETEIGSGIVNIKSLKVSDCECLRYTDNSLALTFKHSNIGEHIFENVYFDDCSGDIAFYAADINKSTVKNAYLTNHKGGNFEINCKVYNIYANGGWFIPDFTFIRGGRDEEIQNVIVDGCNINGGWSFSGGGIVEIDNMTIKDCAVITPDDTNGLFRTSGLRIRNLKFINFINKSTRLFEGCVQNLYIDGMKSEKDIINNYIFFTTTDFASESNVFINNLNFNNTSQSAWSDFIVKAAGHVVNYKKLTNSFFKNRMGVVFEYEANVYPVASGTTAQRPTLNNNLGKLYYNSTLGVYEVFNGTNWVKFINDATVTETGIIKKSAAVPDVTSANARDLATALTLVNELKDKLNSKLTVDRNSGQQAIQ